MKGEVVVVLPYVGDRVLMQLRDFKPEIPFPGCWGFFGGAICEGETPEEAARRELFEEIGFAADRLWGLGKANISDLNDLVSHSFFCPLTRPLEELVLSEGADFALASLEEVVSSRVYSPKIGKSFPVAHTYYIPETMRQALTVIARVDKNL
jgi:8-oxo-dGTP pyrophosphatase MutT (NUDIX family)